MSPENNCHTDNEALEPITDNITDEPLDKSRLRTYKRAADRALVKLANAVEATCHHPYLEDNEIGTHDLSVDKYGNLLAVMVDLKTSFKNDAYIPTLQNLLTITPNGELGLEPKAKFYGCAVMLGHRQLRHLAKNRLGKHEIFIAVDYPTGAFLHEETGSPVAVSVQTCNLTKVYTILRQLFPNAAIVACLNVVPNKHRMRKKIFSEINQSGGIALVPRFSLKERHNGLMSFNDLAMYHQNRDRVLETMLNMIQFPHDYDYYDSAGKKGKSAKAKKKAKTAAKPKESAIKMPKKSAAPKAVPKKTTRKPIACQQEARI